MLQGDDYHFKVAHRFDITPYCIFKMKILEIFGMDAFRTFRCVDSFGVLNCWCFGDDSNITLKGHLLFAGLTAGQEGRLKELSAVWDSTEMYSNISPNKCKHMNCLH